MSVRLTVLGCGDAFGSGGRLNTSFLLDGSRRVLVDCGASTAIALKRANVDPVSIDTIVLSHLHGDHFAGIPFLIRETEIVTQRTRPLTIIGPPGHERRIMDCLQLMFPSPEARTIKFPVEFIEYSTSHVTNAGGVQVRAWPARHSYGTNPHVIRIELDTASVAFSGDTEWVDGLIEAAAGADLFICECFALTPVRNHLDYETITARLPELRCRQMVLTHMAADVLAAALPEEPARAYDGMRLEI